MSEHRPHISPGEVEKVYVGLKKYLFPFFAISLLGDVSLLLEARNEEARERWLNHTLVMELMTFLPVETGMPGGGISALVGFSDGEYALALVLVEEGLARQGSYFPYKFQEYLKKSSRGNMPGIPVLTRPIYSLMYETLMRHGSSKA